MSQTQELLQEAAAKHREIKRELLTIMGQFDIPNMTKENLKDKLFQLYLKIK